MLCGFMPQAAVVYLLTPDEEVVYHILAKRVLLVTSGFRQCLQQPSVGSNVGVDDAVHNLAPFPLVLSQICIALQKDLHRHTPLTYKQRASLPQADNLPLPEAVENRRAIDTQCQCTVLYARLRKGALSDSTLKGATWFQHNLDQSLHLLLL